MTDYTLPPELEKEFDSQLHDMEVLDFKNYLGWVMSIRTKQEVKKFIAKSIAEAEATSYRKGMMKAYRVIAEHTDVFNKYPSLKSMILGDNPIKGE